MTSENVPTRIVDIAEKEVLLLDLLWSEELHSLVVLCEMNEAQFGPCQLSFGQQEAHGRGTCLVPCAAAALAATCQQPLGWRAPATGLCPLPHAIATHHGAGLSHCGAGAIFGG